MGRTRGEPNEIELNATHVLFYRPVAVPLDLTPLLNNGNVGAILHAGQPSIQTQGVADVLFGLASPARKQKG